MLQQQSDDYSIQQFNAIFNGTPYSKWFYININKNTKYREERYNKKINDSYIGKINSIQSVNDKIKKLNVTYFPIYDTFTGQYLGAANKKNRR